MVIVRINQWEEFLKELKEHQPPDKMVRLTFSIRYDKREVPYLTMVAGFLESEKVRIKSDSHGRVTSVS